VSRTDKDTLTDLKQKKFGVTEPEEEKRRRKKKGGPNPLSCKKKKSATENKTVTTNKKKRKRPKVPKHVQEQWASIVKEELANKNNSLASEKT
jgi:U3 small nucleolar RNA-associated protein 23